jgi:hypothetical protein
MAGSIWDWSQTAADNDDADAEIEWRENMAARGVNNSARAMMRRIAQLTADISGKTATTGSAGTYALTTLSPFTAYADGVVVGFTANHTNTSTATLNANAIGAKAIYSNGLPLAGGEIVSGGIYLASYDAALNSAAGAWNLISPPRLGRVCNVRDFGAIGDNTADDTAAFLAAIDYLEYDSDYRGGILYVPRGRYKITSTLTFTAYNSVHNIRVVGEGMQASTLDFASATAGTDGIAFGDGAHFGVEDLTIRSAQRHGISVNQGDTPGAGGPYALWFVFKNLRIQASTNNAIDMVNCYLGRLEQIWARDGANGIVCRGYHTTITMDRVYAESNTSVGFSLAGMVASTFNGCAADRNAWGFTLANMVGAKFNGCYGEENTRHLFYATTSTASVGSLPTQTENISSVSFDGCWAYDNSDGSPGTYASFLNAETANSRAIKLEIANCSDYTGGGSPVSVTLNGASGAVRAHITGCSFDGAVNEFNTVYVSGDNSAGFTTTAEVVATNGATLTWPTPDINYVSLTPAGTIAGYTITLPSNPKTGTVVRVSTTNTITTLTINGGTNNGPATLAAGGSFALCYFNAATAWRRCQ